MAVPVRFVLRSCLALAVLAASAQGAHAQEDCEFADGTGNLNMVTLSGGATITYIGTPHMYCRGGVEIWADSAVSYSAQGMEHLIGRVRFYDASGELRADEARYFSQQGRLQAEGNLFVQDTIQGFTIENGRMVYLRQTQFREDAQIDVRTGFDNVRPRAIVTMAPAETEPNREQEVPEAEPTDTLPLVPIEPVPEPGASNSPYVVDGDRIQIQGNTYFRATGNVEIERDSLKAFADSAEYDQVAGRIFLQGSARVDGPTYDLTGRTINLGMDGNEIDEVVARHEALLTGDDLRLTAQLIRMYMDAGALDRLIAVNLPPDPENPPDSTLARPRASSQQFQLTADSLEVVAPGEVLEEIFAVGQARSVSYARDSLNVSELPEVARNDWLEGDTVIVTFLPTDSTTEAAADTAQGRYRIDRIVARFGARSLYRLPPADTTAAPGVDAPAVHYVLGDEITIVMVEGEVDRMEVVGQTRGVHLEPLAPPADSLAPDTATAADTTAIDTVAVGAPDAEGRNSPTRRPQPGPGTRNFDPPAANDPLTSSGARS